MGLLDYLDSPDAQFAVGLMQASGPSRTPVGFGQVLAGGMEARRNAQQAQMLRQVQQMQMDKMKQDWEDDQEARNFDPSKFFISPQQQALQMGGGPTPEAAALIPKLKPKLDQQALIEYLMKSRAPSLRQKGFELATKEDKNVIVPDGAAVFNERTKEKLFENPKVDKDAKPASVKEYEVAQGQGYQGSFLDFQLAQKRAGATQIGLKTEVKQNESLATQVGPMMKDAKIQADGAVKMFDAADRIEKAINSNKVSAGPLTSLTMPVKQFFGGSTENVRQTRQVIKALAQMAVEARKQLQGQGQVTESEANAVMKADAGQIDDLTVGELQDLVALAKRASHFTAKGYFEQLNTLGSQDATKGLVPFYRVQGIDPLLKHSPQLPQIGKRNPADVFNAADAIIGGPNGNR